MAVTKTQIAGWFKEKYGEVSKTLPNVAYCQKRWKFSERERLGNEYHFPVFLRRPHGTTWAGGDKAGTAYDLNAPKSLVSKDAKLSGGEFVLQEDIAYGVLTRAQSQGEEAFGEAMEEVVLQMRESASYYLEMALLYGGTNIGAISARVSGGGTGVQVFTLTDASWAPGLWAGMEGAYVDVFTPALTTKRNAAGTIEITEIDPDLRRVEMTGTIAELDAIVATDVIVPRGALEDATPTYNWFYGLDKIATTTSGTIFNISATDYHMWRGNVYDFKSKKATFAKIQAALTKAVVRGLMEDVDVLCPTYTWTDVMNDLSALRRFASETKTEMKLGTNSIEFHGANGGTLSLVNHIMVKAGDLFIVPPKRMRRVGSAEITFRIPGVESQEDAMFQELESKAGVRLRCMWDQALVSTHPARVVKGKDVAPESLAEAA